MFFAMGLSFPVVAEVLSRNFFAGAAASVG
jgi:hypothetical protein